MEKKIKLKKGLTLNKESIVKLQDSQMMNLRGGMVDQDASIKITSCWYLLSCISSCGHNSCNTTTTKTEC